MSNNIGWREYLITQGMDPGDVPYTPILGGWEGFPIIKAIRRWERIYKAKYVNNAPEVAEPYKGRNSIFR